MRVFLFYSLIALALFSCKKPEKVAEETYELPWSTEYISYTNFAIGNHGHGFKIFYKSKVIKEEWDYWGGPAIVDSLLIDKQNLYLVKNFNNMGYGIVYTKDGGVTWKQKSCGPQSMPQFHIVDTSLIYTTIPFGQTVFFTGLGESDLESYRDTLSSGVHYISDLSTNTNLDSTIITIGDTAQYVILFH